MGSPLEIIRGAVERRNSRSHVYPTPYVSVSLEHLATCFWNHFRETHVMAASVTLAVWGSMRFG